VRQRARAALVPSSAGNAHGAACNRNNRGGNDRKMGVLAKARDNPMLLASAARSGGGERQRWTLAVKPRSGDGKPRQQLQAMDAAVSSDSGIICWRIKLESMVL
jgi:hypothetical protein